MDPKETFLQIYDEAIVREGADKLRAYLLRSDFFEAPASIRYHSNHAGGLCAHSVNVYRRLLLLYGDAASMDIESVAEEGTVVTMTIPIEREGETLPPVQE